MSKTIHMWYPPPPKQYTVDCCIIYLQKMYLHPYPPFVYLFPLSKLPYTLCIVVDLLPRVMNDCYYDTLSPSLSPSPGDGSSADAFRFPHNINRTMARMVRRVRRHVRMVDCCMLHKLIRGRLSVHDVRRRTINNVR